MRNAAILNFSAILAMTLVFAEATPDYDVMLASNTLGVTKVTSAAEYLPLAITYGAVSAGTDAPSKADGLVMTSNLEAGDELFVYDHENGKYDVFELEKAEDGTATWKSRRVVVISNGGVTVEDGAAALRNGDARVVDDELRGAEVNVRLHGGDRRAGPDVVGLPVPGAYRHVAPVRLGVRPDDGHLVVGLPIPCGAERLGGHGVVRRTGEGACQCQNRQTTPLQIHKHYETFSFVLQSTKKHAHRAS